MTGPHRPLTSALALLAALCLLAGCASSADDEPAPASIAVGVPGFQLSHAGGTLIVDTSSAPGSMDPQIAYNVGPWQIAQAVYDGLLAFKKVGGAQSLTIVPDLATALPMVTNGGRIYTFTLRRGIRFSDGQPVTTADVLASFRRIYKASGPTAGTFFQHIVGAGDCLQTPKTCTLPGVTADPATNTITIELTRPDAQFPDKLALPHAAIVPASTPDSDQGITPIPGTGPYYIASYDPNTHLTLARNPHFRQWSAAAQPQGYPNEIDYHYGLTVDAAVTQVENGQADWMTDPLPADRLDEVGSGYASQVRLSPLPAFWYLPLNVNIPPFNNLQARQAVEWAVDRNAAVDLYGGPHMATPACTILPPGFPEHVNFCDYTKGGGSTWQAPDLAKARQLVKESGTAGQPVAIVVSNDSTNLAVGQYLQTVLTQIGYQATLKPLSNDVQFTYIQNSKNKVQVSLTQWYEDYPAASDFIDVLLSCASYHPGSDSSINMGGYCDPGYDAQIAQATSDDQNDPARAKLEWGQLDEQAMAKALLVPLFFPDNLDFVSKRVGNYQFTDEFYLLVDQLWVR